MTGGAGRLAARIGRRGSALLFFAFLDAVYCAALLTAPRPLVPLYAYLAGVMPLGTWAAVWGGVGMACLVYAFRAYDTVAFMCAVALKVAWGLLSFWGWAFGHVDRGWLNAVIWLAFACFVFLIAGGIPAAPPRPIGRRWVWIRS
ncbi:hypothetical protein [Actinoplanes regularis]|uniref:hypothetical protein n=1 Tax=Actinoplanes regularis TaxID=52697 RepID=UPI0024A2864B|nr:hypothetical protein [Actinoplanes regularis]GLW32283.1 hypothetical protein Areg01_52220 [Actinoplanes regularis]